MRNLIKTVHFVHEVYVTMQFMNLQHNYPSVRFITLESCQNGEVGNAAVIVVFSSSLFKLAGLPRLNRQRQDKE